MAVVVAFEGLSGSGKSTVVKEVLILLRKKKYRATRISVDQTGHTAALKGIANKYSFGNQARTLLHWALRLLQSEVIVQKSTTHDIIMADRYFGSTFVYDIYGKGIPIPLLVWIMRGLVRPDLTIFIDTPLAVCIQRKQSKTLDDPVRAEKIASGYAETAVRHGWERIDGTQPPETIAAQCLALILQRLPRSSE